MSDDVRRMEEKIAYLERHVTEQDKAMLETATQLDVLKREVVALRERLVDLKSPEGLPVNEKPPHY